MATQCHCVCPVPLRVPSATACAQCHCVCPMPLPRLPLTPRAPPLHAVLCCLAAGVAAVLGSCPKLRRLSLQQCYGAVSGADVLAAAAQQLPSRWQLQELQLHANGGTWTDQQAWHLLGQLPAKPLCPPSSTAVILPAGTSLTAAVMPQPGSAPAPHPQLLLQTLALVGVRGLTDALLGAISRASGGSAPLRLAALRLEECYALDSTAACTCDSSNGACSSTRQGACSSSTNTTSSGGGGCCGACGGGWVPSFTQASLQALLAASPRLTALRLRHSSRPLSEGFVEAAARACPALRHLSLDACDLVGGGFTWDASAQPHAALECVQVMGGARAGSRRGAGREGGGGPDAESGPLEPACVGQTAEILAWHPQVVKCKRLDDEGAAGAQLHGRGVVAAGAQQLLRRGDVSVSSHMLLQGRTLVQRMA